MQVRHHKILNAVKAEQERLDPALNRILTRIRLRAKRRIAWLRKLWAEEGQPGSTVAVTHAEIDTYLENRDSPEAEKAWYEEDGSLEKLNYEINRVESAIERDSKSRFAILQAQFALSSAESDLLQLCLAPALDPALTRVYAYLHDHAGRGYATEELAIRLFGLVRRPILSGQSPLRLWELLHQTESVAGEPSRLTCDPYVRDWLLGHDRLDDMLVAISQIQEPLAPLKSWQADEAYASLKQLLDAGSRVRVEISGGSGTGRRTLAAVLSANLGCQLIAIDSDAVDDQRWQSIFLRAQRQAVLHNTIPAWQGEKVSERPWPQNVPTFPAQFVISGNGKKLPHLSGIIDIRIEMPEPSLEERRGLWKKLAPSIKNAEDIEMVTTQHRIPIGEISRVGQHRVQSTNDVTRLVRDGNRKKLGALAQLLESSFTRDDLVVPDNLRETLEDIEFEAQERIAFWQQPKPRRLFPQGRGLLCLFSGSPGTGKTMSAQVIARNLGLDLFRVDLSTVVSKYVGETSQNLERILSQAATMDIVLLFDEADALFAKRTENIKDAHDRFANTDTSYLLQAIENYPGVAILATNKKGNIDPAFMRRIRYVLEFPKPDDSHREVIWKKVLGELAGSHHVDKLELEIRAMAEQLELTGAQIKFALLTALFVARKDRRILGMNHLLRGVERELMKEGRVLTAREKERLGVHGK